MSAFVGVISKKGKLLKYDILSRPMREMAYWQPDYSEIWHGNTVALGNHLLKTTLESENEMLPFFDMNSHCCIVADARIDYREELAKLLEVDWRSVKDKPDSYFILEAYLKWGEDCVTRLYGDFAFAIWESKSEKLFCARDHFGCRPFYYQDTEEFFYFSTDLLGLTQFPALELEIDEENIVNNMARILSEKHKSAYLRIHRLRPSYTLVLERNGNVSSKNYWNINNNSTLTDISEQDAINGLKSRFKDAIKQRCRTEFPIGVELSGGLDSSAIACTLSNISKSINRQIIALSQVLSGGENSQFYPYKDEAKYSALVVKEAGIKKHLLITGEEHPGILSAINKYLKIVRRPLGQGYAMLSDLLYHQASKSGIKVLLSGFGGDEGVTSQASGYLEELHHDRNWNVLKQHLLNKYGQNKTQHHLSLIKHFLFFNIPLLLSLSRIIRNRRNIEYKRYHRFPVNSILAKKYHLKSKYFQIVRSNPTLNVRIKQYSRLHQNHISDRLENSFYMAQSNRIEYRYPFWDVKLIEFYYSLPSKYKVYAGVGRYVFREAMKGIVPEQIRNRTDKSGTTIPNAHFRLWKDESAFRRIIEDSKAKNTYHYVDYKKLEIILDQLLKRKEGQITGIGPRAFFSAISILLLQKQQREGKTDIGIKC